MQWTRSELVSAVDQKVTFDQDITVDPAEFTGNPRILRAENVHADGEGWYDAEADQFEAALHVTGTMIVPDAISNQELSVPFETEGSEVYVFHETSDADAHVVTNETVSLLPAVVNLILLEVPLAITEQGSEEMPSGNGWRVISEAEYEKGRKDRIDPRLAKLKQFKSKDN